jgi:hypothetical protein
MNIRVYTQIVIQQLANNPVVSKLEQEIAELDILVYKMKSHQKRGVKEYYIPGKGFVEINAAIKDFEGMLHQKEMELFVQGSSS